MARVLLLCVLLYFQILQCLSQEQEPSVGEYFLEAVDLANRTRWRYFLPEDTDIDQDGDLSDLEVQHKFNTYMGEVFKLIDDDKDNSITEEEFRSLKLDIPHLTKAVDIALENFPLRPFFLAADGNGDGVYDQNDFYWPEGHGVRTDVEIDDNNRVSLYYGAGVANIGHNEGTVICKSLGRGGLVRVVENGDIVRDSTNSYSSSVILSATTTTTTTTTTTSSSSAFSCDGTEARLEDCQESYGSREQGMGVICEGGKNGPDQGLSDLVGWRRTHVVWEESGKFLFIADANGDGKLTLEELAAKGKELMTKILEFLDENQDGKISLEDINLHLSVGPIQNLVSELFDDVTAGEGEFDLYNLKLAGQDMTKYRWTGLKQFDNNGDEKINTADVFRFLNSRRKATYLIPLLTQKLDKNQDGKIQGEELRQFIDEMFNEVDMDKNGALTLEDAYILLRENGLNCLQVGALRSYIKVFLDTIDTETRNFFGYIFHQFDMDGNGQISPTELEQMHVPCDYGYVSQPQGRDDPRSPYYVSPRSYPHLTDRSAYGYGYYTTERSRYGYYTTGRSRYGYYTTGRPGYRFVSPRSSRLTTGRSGYGYGYYTSERSIDYDYNSNDDSDEPNDPNARKECGEMYQTFFGRKIVDLIRSFPDLDMGSERDAGPGRGGPGQRRGQSFYAQKGLFGILEDKMIDRTCEMLT